MRRGTRYVSVAHPDGTIDFDTYSVMHSPGRVWCDETIAGYIISRSTRGICALAIVCYAPCWRRPICHRESSSCTWYSVCRRELHDIQDEVFCFTNPCARVWELSRCSVVREMNRWLFEDTPVGRPGQ